MLQISAGAEDQRAGLPRRSFLQLGTLTLAGLTGADLTVPHLAQAAGEPAVKTSVILLWMAGGPSHIDTYDMKPNAPAEVRGPFSPISTNLPGLDVCDLMPRHAAIANKLSVIRSLHHTLSVHDDASHWLQTGYPLLQARERGQQQPCQGSVASKLRGACEPGVPAYACVPEDYRSHMGFYQAATYLGSRYNAVNAGGDPSIGKYRPPEFQLPTEVNLARFSGRRELLRTFDATARQLEAAGALESMDENQRQAFDLIAGSRARDIFDITRESDAMRDRYGRHGWGQSTLMARRLVEAGATFVTVNLYEKDVDWWDDHYVIEKNLRKRLPIYDQALSALIEDLHERGLGERVLVVACGEFGRNPRIDAHVGRGHWPRAMHAVLSGGGIREGQIIGSTTSNGGEPQDRPFGPGDLLASIYKVLGIDHDTYLPDRQNRPTRLVEHGEPIAELFA
ncbi:MAG: hypothetical protein JWN70_604 [Planctomycetaceae bacterium]|nr:hypothetical protein [Planctomycetaceae bacterium]